MTAQLDLFKDQHVPSYGDAFTAPYPSQRWPLRKNLSKNASILRRKKQATATFGNARGAALAAMDS